MIAIDALFTPSPFALVLAFAIDRLFGEPPARFHPVVFIGRAVDALVRRAPSGRPAAELAFGCAVALLVPAGAAAVACAVRALAVYGAPFLALEALALSTLFAVRALGEAARGLQLRLERADLAGARYALRDLCSRDASDLAEDELAAAAIESTAENTSDSVVAPLFYYALFGLPGAAAYRAVNTLDAMIGYRGRFEYLGKAAARLDDALNLIPARITALLILASGVLARARVRDGLRVWRRDARATESPNAGHPMAVMAGLLGVRLEKRGCYALGDAVRATESGDVARAVRIAASAAWLALALAIVVSGGRIHGLR